MMNLFTNLKVLAFGAAAALGATAQSDAATLDGVVFDTQIGVMKSADGSRTLGDGTFAFYADQSGDGLSDLTDPTAYDPESADDLFLGAVEIGVFFGEDGFLSGSFQYDVPANSTIQGVFYDTQGFDPDAPGVGVDFGIVPGVVELGTTGGNFTYNFTTTEVFGSNDPSTLFATSGTTIPEPSTAVLAALGGLAIFAGRRRSA
jgi:hypothetical protein